ncbi:alpha/beta fold hydrolase [Chroococcidiopsis sp. CCMEE 29]|uniref:alpha/beta fold hydrolase n=1 Tax=Chroococcidiopsis sp. CCMEE 29 TaxID=155894 RepID=UPI00201FCB5D|nr:alpha/beta fold hydrolase [Chroococcidiopsis sp. CCMEE 29]
MNRQRLFVLFTALLLILLSWWRVAAAQAGLEVRSLERDGVPMLYVAPQQGERMPGVLIAHGFAGSKQLMLGYAYVLAHTGYAVMLWDFGGHGANATPLERLTLQQDLGVAYTVLRSQPEVDPTRLALLGHSMGSGAAMSAGIRNSDRFAATVAISPTGAAVTPQMPRNLQLQAGSREGRFIFNAQRLLQEAGGENQNLAEGRGRSLVTIPQANHITVLFHNLSHQAARRWLDATFSIQATNSYVDRRMTWYGLHLLAWLMMLGAVAPALNLPSVHRMRAHWVRSWGGLLLAPLAASVILTLSSRVGEIQSLGGLLVGGAVGIWLFVAGIVWLVILSHLPRPTIRVVVLGIALFILLWVAFGAMAQVVWLQWWLIPARLQLWPLLSLACFPWFLASGVAQQGVGIGSRLIWWLGQSVVLVGGFFLTLQFLPQLSFIFLLLPLFPIFMAIFSFAAAMLNEAWSYALGSALFFGWVIAAAFPLGVS